QHVYQANSTIERPARQVGRLRLAPPGGALMSSSRRWVRVTRAHPCPICGHGDWCRISADGALAGCMRTSEGSFRSWEGRDGSIVHLHRLIGGPLPAAALPPVPGPTRERADADTLHAVYANLLECLTLSTDHREALRRRGLPDDEIDRRGYRTLPI